MRKGILGSITALLAGTALAFAQPAATSDPAPAAAPNGTGQPAPLPPAHEAAPPAAEPPRSPYWPNPFSYPPPWGAPAVPPGAIPDVKTHGELVITGSAEYLLWWVKNQPLGVPLVTTGTPTGLGALGSPDTVLLFGGNDIDYHTFSGGRFTLGIGWGHNSEADWSVEGSGFFLEKRPAQFLATSSVTGVPLLARPIVNALTNTETSALISSPGVASGAVVVNSFSDLYGWDVDFVRGWYREGPLHLELLGGFRYVHLDEALNIGQESILLNGGTAGLAGNPLLPPTTVTIFDHFGTRNEFYGGQLAARLGYNGDRWFVSALGKVALGSTHEVINLSGFTSNTGGGGTTPALTPGGLLVVSSNRGSRAHDEFAVIPEIGINIGYQVCHSLRVFVGYTFLYWSDVARPGDQVNRTVNPTIVPASQTFNPPTGPFGPAQPSFTFTRTDFWAQGVNFGFEVRY
ncbi:MAG TPA: BBP7 family outer membrane beta-barrel protein [Gemmataceae bacterium]|nr:BBP7 family outer membrane beta-barrel protein [Gemmataceae bacterium]